MARRYNYGINLAPFIDVVFILLAFMLIYARIDTEKSMEVELPMASGENLEQNKTVIISIDKENHLFLGETPINAEKLETELSKIVGKQDIIIQADKNSTSQALVQLMEILSQSQVTATQILVSGK